MAWLILILSCCEYVEHGGSELQGYISKTKLILIKSTTTRMQLTGNQSIF